MAIGQYKGQDIQAGTDAEVQAQMAKIDTGSTQPQQISPINPTIPVSALTVPTQTPAKVIQPAPSTGMAGLQGAVNASQDAFTAGLAEQTAQAQANLKQYKDPLYQALLGGTTTGEATNQAYAETVDPAQKALQEINQQIVADQVATRHQIEDLQKNNPNGLYGGALEQAVQTIQDAGTRRQADLAVIQLSKQGQYDSAKAIADRAVSALMEKQKARLDALQFMYNDNKDLFTKAEQRQFETAQADRNRKLEMDAYKEKARFDQVIKQNDPLYQANLKKVQQDLQDTSVVASATFAKQPGFNKLGQTDKTKAVALNNLINQLNTYRDAYAQKVGVTGTKLTGEDAAILEGQLNSLLFAAAQAEGTGALQAADRAVLEKVIPNPTAPGAAIGNFLKGGKVGGLSKIDQQVTKYTSNLGSYGLKPTTAPTNNTQDPLGLGIGGNTNMADNPLGL